MSYFTSKCIEKKIGIERIAKREAWPEQKGKEKENGGGIFLISRDKYEGRGGFLCFLPQTPTASHAQRKRKRKRRGGEEEAGGGGRGD